MTILVAEDNPDCRDLYSIWLSGDHAVEVVPDGTEALAAVDPETDLLFLDRDMPGPPGTEVAREVAHMACDPYVVMVSSMDPEFDIVEMPIDRYVQKPVEQREIEAIITQCRTQDEYRRALDQFFSLTAKLAAIETEKADDVLADSPEYDRLKERVAEKRAEVDDALTPGQIDWSLAFKNCPSAVEGHSSNGNA